MLTNDSFETLTVSPAYPGHLLTIGSNSSEVVLQTLEACAPEYPELPEKDKANLAACKAALLAE